MQLTLHTQANTKLSCARMGPQVVFMPTSPALSRNVCIIIFKICLHVMMCEKNENGFN